MSEKYKPHKTHEMTDDVDVEGVQHCRCIHCDLRTDQDAKITEECPNHWEKLAEYNEGYTNF